MASSKTVNRWHPEEDIELKKLYKSKSVDELAKHFHRSEGSIKSRITKIKHKSIESLNFQLEEYKNLKKYKAHKNNQKANIMSSSITGKLWTTEEDIELKKLYKSKSVDELAEYFNRSEGSIKSRLTKIRHKSIQSLNVQLRDERNHNKRSQVQDNKVLPTISKSSSKSPKSFLEKVSSVFLGPLKGFGLLLLGVSFIFLFFKFYWVWLFLFMLSPIINFFQESSGSGNYRRDYHANDDQFGDFND